MKREIIARKITRRGPDDEIDPEFWARVTPDERFAKAWRLSEDIWRLKGWDPVMRNKQALGRPKDLVDLDLLRRHHRR